MNGISDMTNQYQRLHRGDNMEHITLALVGIIMASIIVPISTIAMLKVVPRNGGTSQLPHAGGFPTKASDFHSIGEWTGWQTFQFGTNPKNAKIRKKLRQINYIRNW